MMQRMMPQDHGGTGIINISLSPCLFKIMPMGYDPSLQRLSRKAYAIMLSLEENRRMFCVTSWIKFFES